MQMLILQVLLWLLFALIAGLATGWLVRPYFCRDCVTDVISSDSTSAQTLTPMANTSEKKVIHDDIKSSLTTENTAAVTAVAAAVATQLESDDEVYLDDPELLADLEIGLETADTISASSVLGSINASTTKDSTQSVPSANIKAGAPTIAAAPKEKRPDDLTRINGIGKPIETILHDIDVHTFQQIADFTPENISDYKENITWPGAVNISEWVEQARVIIGEDQVIITDEMKPILLSEPRAGSKRGDDLKRVKGIGKVLERRLKELGIYHYDQIADLTEDQVMWITDYITFPQGRIQDEAWVSQAKALAEGEDTEYSNRFDSGDTPYQ